MSNELKCLTHLIKSLLSSSQQPSSQTFDGSLDMNNTVFTLADAEGKDHVVGYPHKGGLARSEVLREVLLLIKFFRHATPRRWMSGSRRLEVSKRLLR